MPVTNYVWDGDQYLMETDDTNTTTAVFTNEPDEYTNLISQCRDGASQYAHYDALGSTRQLTDDSETVTDQRIYDGFGNMVSHTGTTEFPFWFVGRFGYYYDSETDTNYVIWRILEPENGRWLSGDFVNLFDFYVYSSNNPIILIDPFGLAACQVSNSPSPNEVNVFVTDLNETITIGKDTFPYNVRAYGGTALVKQDDGCQTCCHLRFWDVQKTGNKSVVKESGLGFCQPVRGHTASVIFGPGVCGAARERALTAQSIQQANQYSKKYQTRAVVAPGPSFLLKKKPTGDCSEYWVQCATGIIYGVTTSNLNVKITTEDLKKAIDTVQGLGFNPTELQEAEKAIESFEAIIKGATGKIPYVAIKGPNAQFLRLYIVCADGTKMASNLSTNQNNLTIEVGLTKPKE